MYHTQICIYYTLTVAHSMHVRTGPYTDQFLATNFRVPVFSDEFSWQEKFVAKGQSIPNPIYIYICVHMYQLNLNVI